MEGLGFMSGRMNTSRITIFLNGRAQQIPAGMTVRDLLNSRQLGGQRVLVEVNEHALLTSEWDSVEIHHGDRIELIRVVAGG